MRSIFKSILVIALPGLLSQCRPKEFRDEERGAPERSHPVGNLESDGPDGTGGGSAKVAGGAGMNRNAVIHGILTQAKPDWLSIGPSLSVTMSPDMNLHSGWKRLEASKFTFSAGGTIGGIGELELPETLAATAWSAASPDPGGERLLMVPLEMTEPAALFRIEAGRVVPDSMEEVPSINYDDKRRWFIQWETWISDSEIVGVFNEEDVAGHTVTRSGLYLYDVDSRELKRVDLPYGFIDGSDPAIGILAASPEGLLIQTADGEKAVVFKR